MIFITGNQGFIGKRLTSYLREKGYEVDGCDIKNGEDFEDVSGQDIVVHCAAFVSVTESVDEPRKYIENNISKLLKLIRNNKKIIFLSTGGALYGDKENAREEDAQIDLCTNPYAMTKLVGEWLVRFYCSNYLILRLANVYGDGEDDRGEPNVFTHFRYDNPITVYGGTQTRDFIKVEKVIEVIEKGIKEDIKGTYNIGSGEAVKIMDLAEEMSEKRKVPIVLKDKRVGEVENITLSINKARKAGLL